MTEQLIQPHKNGWEERDVPLELIDFSPFQFRSDSRGPVFENRDIRALLGRYEARPQAGLTRQFP